jgi:hypothetical protein
VSGLNLALLLFRKPLVMFRGKVLQTMIASKGATLGNAEL